MAKRKSLLQENHDDKWLLVAIPEQLHQSLKSEAALRGETLRELVIGILKKHLGGK